MRILVAEDDKKIASFVPYALMGDTAKSRAAYNAFLFLWKDGDPNIPILNQATTEYTRLQ